MIEGVANRGYAATSVADVLALAGVSRRAFYELFANKQDCFLATHDSVVAHSRKVALEAWAGQRGWANRLHAGCKELLEDMAASPNGPRLALVEAYAAGPDVRVRMHLANRVFERMVVSAFSSAPEGPELYRLTAKAIVSGVRQVLAIRLRDGRHQEIHALTDEVLDLSEAYHSELVARLGVKGASAASDANRNMPAAFLLVGDERARSLSSVLHLTFDSGYEDLSDPQVADFAGISTEAFHGHFATKEEAFLALLDAISHEALEWARERAGDGASWPEMVQSALAAFVDYAVSHEALMRISFVELFAVGSGALDHRTKLVDELTGLLLAGAPKPLRAPLIAEEAVAGALWGSLSSCVAARRVFQLPWLVEHLSFFVLAPYIGSEDAFEAIRTARRPPYGD
jgi:AcrR family transcriptional regulator